MFARCFRPSDACELSTSHTSPTRPTLSHLAPVPTQPSTAQPYTSVTQHTSNQGVAASKYLALSRPERSKEQLCSQFQLKQPGATPLKSLLAWQVGWLQQFYRCRKCICLIALVDFDSRIVRHSAGEIPATKSDTSCGSGLEMGKDSLRSHQCLSRSVVLVGNYSKAIEVPPSKSPFTVSQELIRSAMLPPATDPMLWLPHSARRQGVAQTHLCPSGGCLLRMSQHHLAVTLSHCAVRALLRKEFSQTIINHPRKQILPDSGIPGICITVA